MESGTAKFILAIVAILIIGLLVEFSPRLGWTIAGLALLAMVANQYGGFQSLNKIGKRIINIPRSGRTL